LTFNGVRVGEIGLNALIAGYYKVPVIMISGDKVACREASDLIPGIETAVVKESIGAYAGICYHPVKCREMIYKTVQNAVARHDSISPLVLEGQVRMTLRMTTASGIDRALRLPGAERISGDTLKYEAENYYRAFQAFLAIADLRELVPFI